MSWVLMSWRHEEPGHQQPWYWLCWTVAHMWHSTMPEELVNVKRYHKSSSHIRVAALRHVSMSRYNDVIMGAMPSQITCLTIVYSTVYSGADQRKPQSSASLASFGGFTGDRWIHRTKCQSRGKCFHLMTSSCHTVIKIIIIFRYFHISNFVKRQDTKSIKIQYISIWSLSLLFFSLTLLKVFPYLPELFDSNSTKSIGIWITYV